MVADEFLPVYDVIMRHAVSVAAPASVVWVALHRADFAGAWCVRALLILRGLRRPAQRDRLTLDRLVRGVFISLGERRWRFRLYWLAVRPFSALIRRAMLAAVAREATRRTATRPV